MNDILEVPNDDRTDASAGVLHEEMRSFEVLVQRYQSYAYALAMKFLYNKDDACDVVQEAFLRVWTNFDRYDPSRKFTTWLYKIVANLCIDRVRSRNRIRRLFSSSDHEPALMNLPDERDWGRLQSQRQLAEIIAVLGDGLSPRQRLVFTLRDLQDLTVNEVAEITGLSVGSVKTNLFHARKAIRQMLSERYGIIGDDL